VIGLAAFGDEPRASARAAIEGLALLDIETTMISGDSEGAARHIAQQLGLTHYEAEVLPRDKARKVEALRKDIGRYEFEIRSRQRRRRRGAERAAPSEPGASRWLSVAVSIGVAEHGERLVGPEAVLEAADRALYRAKQAGRNRVYH